MKHFCWSGEEHFKMKWFFSEKPIVAFAWHTLQSGWSLLSSASLWNHALKETPFPRQLLLLRLHFGTSELSVPFMRTPGSNLSHRHHSGSVSCPQTPASMQTHTAGPRHTRSTSKKNRCCDSDAAASLLPPCFLFYMGINFPAPIWSPANGSKR